MVEADRTKAVHTIHLRDDWIDTPVVVKAYVHVIGEFEPSVPPTASASTPGGGRRCIVDNFRNILILHPDQLISATVVADSFSCLRRAVLQDRVKATGDTSAPLVYGTLLHEVFQEALLANRFDVKFLDDVISAAVSRHVEDLYVVRIPMSDAREHLRVKIAPLLSWAATFVASQPQVCTVFQIECLCIPVYTSVYKCMPICKPKRTKQWPRI